MSDTMSTYDGLLKNYYDSDKVQNLLYDKNQFLTLVDKNEGWKGDTYKKPVIYGGAQGIGHTFTTAQTISQNTSTQIAAFLLTTRASLYGFTNWSRELMLASDGNAGAFMSVAKIDVDQCLRGIGNTLATALYRSGYGNIANINSSGFSGTATTITLAVSSDSFNFEVGMYVVVGATQSGALRALGTSGNGLIVTMVDRTNGIIGFGNAINDATNGIPTIAAGDFVFVQGNHTSGVTTLPIGLEGWLPPTTPGSGDSFWSVDRSADTRLSGQRLNATDGRPLEEVFIEAAEIVASQGGQLSHFFVSFKTFSKVLKQMQGRLLLTDYETDVSTGFRGANVQTPSGEVMLVPDRTCPDTRIFGLQLDTWELVTLGKMVAPVEEDGLMILRSATADTFESRYAFYGQLVCGAPGWNINVQITP